LTRFTLNELLDEKFDPFPRRRARWILNCLGPFYDKGQNADVLRKVKGGKEANIYCCRGACRGDVGACRAKRPARLATLRAASRTETW
jgi:hypothetical protein